MGGAFQPFAPASATRRTHARSGAITRYTILRDNFTIGTWIALGSLLQGLIFVVLPARYALLPVVALLSHRILRTLLMQFGLIHNAQMDGVYPGKFTAQIPGRNGEPPHRSSGQDITIMILAARSNHPLGMLGPGYRDVADHFNGMLNHLWKGGENYGFLGSSSWLSANERHAGNQIMVVTYFRSQEELHAFAHGPLHSKAWNWWNSIAKTHPYLSIMHEVYTMPKGHWENIFVNNHLTGIAATNARVEIDGEHLRPLFDATRGSLRSQLGRLGRGTGTENGEYGEDVY
ncbi:hypothetical protein B0H67DRAFT_570882 [Lasiosphaeris hirsuta]|uniref:Monooxygenase n=1 Tax=Lasiosphaeris hirsuta TaxID=260670 RepID=A0AA40E3D1_9PEZI|nr:hypothetical protein B0H67DRAFT_570882 [Lasiosphaeris hirsuta]